MISDKNYPLGFTQKFEVIDYQLKRLQSEIDSGQSLNSARYLNIAQNYETGEIEVSLLNYDSETLDTKSITLTGKIIESASVDLANKVINLTCYDDSVVELDISELVDDYVSRCNDLSDRITAEYERATTEEAKKVDKIFGKGLSTNDFTNELKDKLDAIASDAQENVIEDIKVDGVSLDVIDKSVNIDLSNKADKEGPLPEFLVRPADSVIDFIETKGVNGKPIVLHLDIDMPSKYYYYQGCITYSSSRLSFVLKEESSADIIYTGQIPSSSSITFADITSLSYLHVYENQDNKVTSISSASTDIEYPSAKCTYDAISAQQAEINSKVDKIEGKELSENDFTDVLKNKLDNIETGAEVNDIVSIKLNGVELLPDANRAVNVDTTNKVTITTASNKIYGTNGSGQTTYNLDSSDADTNASNVVKRNSTGNVTVPTTPTANTDASSKQYTDSFGKSISLELDENFGITATLYDANHLPLAQEVIDLPIEYDVVNGRYDVETESIMLILRDGTELPVTISALIANLQPKITSSNMLSSELVDDSGSYSHKFISIDEKEQIQANTEAIATKADADDVYVKDEIHVFLSGKQDTLNLQTSFAGKGTATKIPQITTNNLGQVINIAEIPIDAMSSSTRYGANLQMSLDSLTYLLTLQLVDQTGQVLGTPQYVNLPLESMIVDATYNSVTRQLIITLSNGQQLVIPIADMLDGLVPETRTIAGLSLESDISVDALTATMFTITSHTDEEDWDE